MSTLDAGCAMGLVQVIKSRLAAVAALVAVARGAGDVAGSAAFLQLHPPLTTNTTAPLATAGTAAGRAPHPAVAPVPSAASSGGCLNLRCGVVARITSSRPPPRGSRCESPNTYPVQDFVRVKVW